MSVDGGSELLDEPDDLPTLNLDHARSSRLFVGHLLDSERAGASSVIPAYNWLYAGDLSCRVSQRENTELSSTNRVAACKHLELGAGAGHQHARREVFTDDAIVALFFTTE